MIETLADLCVERGVPEHIRSDNGPEFCWRDVREWLRDIGVQTLFIEPGSPWENGYCESFIGKFRDELLNREVFYTLAEARVLIETWRGGVQHHSPAQQSGTESTGARGSGLCTSSHATLTQQVDRLLGVCHHDAE